MKVYYMLIHPKPFNHIKSGIKRIEVRLNYKNRNKIKIGDIIEFRRRPDFSKRLKVRVVGVKKYGFKEMKRKGFDEVRKYYSEESLRRYGLIVFSIKKF